MSEKPESRTNLDRIEDWLKHLLSRPKKPDVIGVWHSSGSNGGPPITMIDIDSDGVISKELARSIINFCKDDASAPGGNQLYILRAMSKSDDSIAMSELKIRITATDVQGISQEATTGVIVAHFLRAHDAAMRQLALMQKQHLDGMAMLAQGYKSQAESLANILEKTQARLSTIEARNLKTLEVLEEVLNHKHDREQDAKRTERDESRKDKMMAWLITIMPAVTRKILGDGAAAAGAANSFLQSFSDEQRRAIADALDKEQMLLLATAMADNAKLADFMKSLSEEQIVKFMGILTPDQVIALEALSDIVDPQKE